MNIAFLLGEASISGGTYVIYEHASRLKDFGHDITIVTRERVEPQEYSWHPAADRIEWLPMVEAEEQVFDIVLATWWESSFLLQHLKARHYVYFVQSIESRFWAVDDPADHDRRDNSIGRHLCESTYSFNLSVITEACWIRDYLYQNYNHRAYLVQNGIRKDIYTRQGQTIAPIKKGGLRVLVEGPVDVFHKNVPKTVDLCRQAGVDEIWLLTSSNINSFPGVDRVFSCLSIHDIAPVYRSCDVLVKLSYIEGMFGPPLEMFHCGGTAIVYDVTGYDEYIIHNENSYVVAKDNDDTVVQYLQKLKQDPQELQRLKIGACHTAESWPDWHTTSLAFENVLLRISNQNPTSRSYLKMWTEKLTTDNSERLRLKELERFQLREQIVDTDKEDRHNFVQLYYWAEKGGLDGKIFKWAYYKSGKPAEISLQVSVTGFPFWLRLDPSVRIGIVIIDSITITNRRLDKQLFICNAPNHFDALYVGGTLRRIEHREKAVYLSYGDDPQLILPAVTEGKIDDELDITICLQEMGAAQYTEMFCLMQAGQKNMGKQRLTQRLIQKINNFLK